MPLLTQALVLTAVVLLIVNIFLNASQGSLYKMGYLEVEGFDPEEPVFTPEGYGLMGQFHGFLTMPNAYRQVKEDGIPRDQLKKMYPAVENFDLLNLA